MDDQSRVRRALVTVSGPDRPGVSSALFERLAGVTTSHDGGSVHHAVDVHDVEQVVIRGQLVLGVEVRICCALSDIDRALTTDADLGGLQITVEADPDPAYTSRRANKHYVVVLGAPLKPAAMAAITTAIADLGANIDSIKRLSDYPVTALELVVSGASSAPLRAALGTTAMRENVDVAVEKSGIERRAKRLIVMDVDSTLVRGEVIDSLAARAGKLDEVAAITERAMRGELDFAQSLTERVAMLEGLPVSVLDEVRRELQLTPGARTLIRTLKRMGFKIGVVSGGFSQIMEPLVAELGLDYGLANTLEVRDGVLTGRVTGRIVDRAQKLTALREFAAAYDIPMSQTVAVGDGANDLDMLSKAGLGIAFNAKPVVREGSHTALNHPYLDALLFFLGISRDEVAADEAREDAASAD